jgi:hypothetical protein
MTSDVGISFPFLQQGSSTPIDDEYFWAQKYAYPLQNARINYVGQTQGTPYVQRTGSGVLLGTGYTATTA